MKKLIPFIVLIFFSESVLAQAKPADERPTVIAREMVKHLELAELDFIKIKNIVELKLQEIETASSRYSNDDLMYQEALNQIQFSFDEAILSILPKKTIPAFKSSRFVNIPVDILSMNN